MIKLDQEPRTWLAQRAIGAGFQSVLFADIRTADDVRACVRVVRPDTPHGRWDLRGRGPPQQLLGRGRQPPTTSGRSRRSSSSLMIEKRAAVERSTRSSRYPGST